MSHLKLVELPPREKRGGVRETQMCEPTGEYGLWCGRCYERERVIRRNMKSLGAAAFRCSHCGGVSMLRVSELIGITMVPTEERK